VGIARVVQEGRRRNVKAIETPWPVRSYADDQGREFRYVLARHPRASGLVVHFSAFFGDWGDARPYRAQFGGYFHRLKMLGLEAAHNWLFLCDAYGAAKNGTYYTGERGDFFVERAMQHIISSTVAELRVTPESTVMAGSSMGATAALKFGLLLPSRGIVAVAPHIDLDVCAERQNRWREVAFICPDGDPVSTSNRPLTRQVSLLVQTWETARPLPRLFVQSCKDDAGVHEEQVLPLVHRWRERGGVVDLDERLSGGHTSHWATKALLMDAFDRILLDEPIPLHAYQTDPAFAERPTRPPLSHKVRRFASLTRKRFRGGH
jgi:hypothetical protein